jgi:peptidyl-prolyl cis-trans isomerase C
LTQLGKIRVLRAKSREIGNVRIQFVRAIALVSAVAIPAWSAIADPASNSKQVATVNGKVITEADMALANAEIGKDVGDVPELTRRRYLLEYLIENQVFADAAESNAMDDTAEFKEKLAYTRRRMLRDMYFNQRLKDAVKDDELLALYQEKLKVLPKEEEVHARHILVKTEDEAKALVVELSKGTDFAKLATERSIDTATKDKGGDLGFFGRGKIVPQVENAAMKLAAGQTSSPVESPYGWHVIKVEERRPKPPPTFESVKQRLANAVGYKKAQDLAYELRGKAKIEYIDPELKKMVENQNAKAKAELDHKSSVLDTVLKAEEREAREKKKEAEGEKK